MSAIDSKIWTNRIEAFGSDRISQQELTFVFFRDMTAAMLPSILAQLKGSERDIFQSYLDQGFPTKVWNSAGTWQVAWARYSIPISGCPTGRAAAVPQNRWSTA